METAVNCLPASSNPFKRMVIALVDLGFVSLGYLIISIPALLVLFQAIRIEGPYSIFSTYLISAITGAACVLFDIVYRVLIPLRFQGRTLGSAFFGSRIVTTEGEDPALLPLLLRAVALVFMVLFTVGLYYVAEAICLYLSKRHIDMTDVVSGTVMSDLPIAKEEKK